MLQGFSSYQVNIFISTHLIIHCQCAVDLLDMMSRIILERNYDAQIEDAFRQVMKNIRYPISKYQISGTFRLTK